MTGRAAGRFTQLAYAARVTASAVRLRAALGVAAAAGRAAVTGAVRHTPRAVGAASALAALASLGLPAEAAAAGLVVLLLATVCWVVASQDRSNHLARIILGLRGDARCLHSAPSPESAATPGGGDETPLLRRRASAHHAR